MATQKKKVVILGAGFAGLFAALEFEKLYSDLPDVEITLLDRQNFHLFVPLLYHVGTGGIDPEAICFPVRAILKNGGSVAPVVFKECEVQNLDIKTKKIYTNRGQYDYDYLVYALGSITNYYGIPGLEENIVPLKTIEDGVAMHDRIVESFEEAFEETDLEKRKALITFVIVGGGATGVELASTMALFVFKTMCKQFPTLSSDARVIIAEAGDALLRGMRPEMAKLALERLKKLGVEVMLNCKVAKATKEGIETIEGKKILSNNVTWVGGIKPGRLIEEMSVEKARDGRVIVNENLEVPSVPGLYVVGDCGYAIQPHKSRPYPPTAQSAVRMGKVAAWNIAREIRQISACPFDYKYKGDIVFIGRNYGAGEFFGRIISGFPAFFLYQTYHLMSLTGFKNKLITLLDWAYDYSYRRSTFKLG